MRSFTVTITLPARVRHPMHALMDEHDAVHRSEMLQWTVGEQDTFSILFRVLADRDVYEAALRTIDSIAQYELVDGDPGELFLYVHETDTTRHRGLVSAFANTDLVAVPPITYLPGGRLSVHVLGSTSALEGALSSLPDDFTIDLETVTAMSTPGRRVGLTQRQRQALKTGRAVGYYNVPRTGSVADVAAELDIASSTAGDHLRRAEAALVDGYLDGWL